MTPAPAEAAIPVRDTVRSMVAGMIGSFADHSWSAYAAAWLDGRLVAGVFIDPVFRRPATIRDFVCDAQVGSVISARERRGAPPYALARALEDAAWAVHFLEHGDEVMAARFVASARAWEGEAHGG